MTKILLSVTIVFYLPIASGSFGRVYLAQHSVLTSRLVALKLMHAIPLTSKQEFEQFLNEAKFLELLHHPYILPILDVGVHEGIPYIVSEYAAGNSLRMRLNKGRCSPREVLLILSQVGQALAYAPRQNIIHRDLKPENILFNARGDALLADFGLATMLSTASVKYMSSAGTPRYMSPEQCRGVVSKESDQYALGCIAYELFCGHSPFSGPDAMALMYQHVNDTPLPLGTYDTHIPPYIEQAVLKALMKQRHERHSSVEVFLAALLPPGVSQPTTIQFPVQDALLQSSEKTTIVPTPIPEPAINDTPFFQSRTGTGSLPYRTLTNGGTSSVYNQESLSTYIPTDTVIPSHKSELIETTAPALSPSSVTTQPGSETSFHTEKAEPSNGKETSTNFSSHRYKDVASADRRLGPAYRRPLVIVTCVLLAIMLSGSLFWIFQPAHPAKPISRGVQPVPSATSQLLLSPSPTSAALAHTPTPTVRPSLTPTHSTTPTSTVISNSPPLLTVNQTSENANTDCSYDATNGWACPMALHNSQSTQSSLVWTAFSQSASVVSFSPANGTLSPGQTATIKVYISNVSCPTTFMLNFSGPVNKVSVPWHCASPTLTASPADLGAELNSCPVSNNTFHCAVYLNVGQGSQGGLNWTVSGSEYLCDVNGCSTGPLPGNTVTPSSGFIVSSANYVQVSVNVPICEHMVIKDTIIFSGPANSATVTYSCDSTS